MAPGALPAANSPLTLVSEEFFSHSFFRVAVVQPFFSLFKYFIPGVLPLLLTDSALASGEAALEPADASPL